MAQTTICDICGEKIDPHLEQGFRVKMLKETFDYDGWPYKHWEQIDMCRDCLNKLYNIQHTPPKGASSMQNN